ncbi:hypothetical protein GCM10009531_54750 [Actinoplanes capillaceus]
MRAAVGWGTGWGEGALTPGGRGTAGTGRLARVAPAGRALVRSGAATCVPEKGLERPPDIDGLWRRVIRLGCRRFRSG